MLSVQVPSKQAPQHGCCTSATSHAEPEGRQVTQTPACPWAALHPPVPSQQNGPLAMLLHGCPSSAQGRRRHTPSPQKPEQHCASSTHGTGGGVSNGVPLGMQAQTCFPSALTDE